MWLQFDVSPVKKSSDQELLKGRSSDQAEFLTIKILIPVTNAPSSDSKTEPMSISSLNEQT